MRQWGKVLKPKLHTLVDTENHRAQFETGAVEERTEWEGSEVGLAARCQS